MNAIIPPAEQVSLTLRGLYQTYGYQQYKMSKFEEYDLYAQNKNFLASPQILTFSDQNGRLMALKPDITLSIIKNTRDDKQTRKVWYTENVYRVPRNACGFREIMQTGLEYIGAIDLYAMCEVMMLAARSLETISPRYVLELSHMGILTGVLADMNVSAATASALMTAFGEKNIHSLTAACAQGGLSEDAAAFLTELCRLSGPAEETIGRLLALPLPPAAMEAARELEALCRLLTGFGRYNVSFDMSVINDTDYYNGLLFRGFVDGIHTGILSGGRYDSLLNRMGRRGGAIGFAVYLDELERFLTRRPEKDVDTLLVYGPSDDPAQIIAAAQAEVARGRTVRVQPAGGSSVTYDRRIGPDGGEA